MKTICLYFEIHQIIHLKRYRFFEIGSEHYYYDDYANEQGMNEVAERSYIPALRTLIDMAKANNGAFKVALSISGVALEQLEIHAPAVIELLHELNATGCCEFLCEPYGERDDVLVRAGFIKCAAAFAHAAQTLFMLDE